MRCKSFYRIISCMLRGAHIDLFPWILGSLVLAVAIPAVTALAGSTDESPRVATGASSPAIAAPPVIPPNLLPKPTTSTPPLPAGQVWQCVRNGVKTFSDSPCGKDASVRQLSEINRMDAPVRRDPAYPAYPVYPPSSAYPPGPVDPDAPDVDGSYATSQIILINERGRREHNFQTHHPGSRPARAHH
jgi:hypothetical protein